MEWSQLLFEGAIALRRVRGSTLGSYRTPQLSTFTLLVLNQSERTPQCVGNLSNTKSHMRQSITPPKRVTSNPIFQVHDNVTAVCNIKNMNFAGMVTAGRTQSASDCSWLPRCGSHFGLMFREAVYMCSFHEIWKAFERSGTYILHYLLYTRCNNAQYPSDMFETFSSTNDVCVTIK